MRCWWCGEDPAYQAYHDGEWGRPASSDERLFEKLCLEGFQSGLSWLTILRKREAFRAAFCGFEIDAVAAFGPADEARLLADAGIVRHRGKIAAAIANARIAQRLRDAHGGLLAYLAPFTPPPSARPSPVTKAALTAQPATEASKALSKALQQQGWRFFGPTTAYAFMQGVGMVNDHLEGCHVRADAEAQRRNSAFGL